MCNPQIPFGLAAFKVALLSFSGSLRGSSRRAFANTPAWRADDKH
jgi:hypothetical protein